MWPQLIFGANDIPEVVTAVNVPALPVAWFRQSYLYFQFFVRIMTFFHFGNCVALSYVPYVIVYRCSGL